MPRSDSDEKYVLDLCDRVLGLTSSRQHRFDFLLGDPNKKGNQVRLPVDAYYNELKLVIEYRERQHIEEMPFFDKPNRITVSGVHRGEQRRIYDERRRQVLPQHGIKVIEISYSDLKPNKQGRIIRDAELDEGILRKKLQDFVRRV